MFLSVIFALVLGTCKSENAPLFFELGNDIGITGDELSPYFYGSEEDMTVVSKSS